MMSSTRVTAMLLAVLLNPAVSLTLQKHQDQAPELTPEENQVLNGVLQAGGAIIGTVVNGVARLGMAEAQFQTRLHEITAANAAETTKRAWTDRTLSATQRADHLLGAMTMAEKLDMIHGHCMSCPWVGMVPGNQRLGTPPLTLHDGPQGVRNEPFARASSTSWPGAMAMASTWDPDAIHEWGHAMGEEFHAKGINVQLGPGVNLARVPTNGRNFEYLSGEDPYLGYRLVREVVKGIQENKVIACAKHWVVNSNEVHRMDGSENVDERTLHEMYYPPFESAVEAGIGAFMCAYNAINGTYACENSPINNDDLKTKLGFNGFMMSDWGATHGKKSMTGGLDQEQPGGSIMQETLLREASAKDSDVDRSVHRILKTMFTAGIMDEPVTDFDGARFGINVSTAEHIALARKLGGEATVLLKNERNVLPLPQNRKIALLGFADDSAFSLAYGHGSGEVVPSTFVPPTVGIREAAGQDAQISFENGQNLEAAKAAAAAADYAVVFVGASASEGADRASLSLDGGCTANVFGNIASCGGIDQYQNYFVSQIAAVNKNTIVVLSVPGAILMPWSNEVASALVNFMPGQESGHAIADVLFGKVNPSAKLPITMPNRENEVDYTTEQYPGVRGMNGQYQMTYLEKLHVGYRYYDFMNKSFTTGFPFGHGLSYTSFNYSGLHFSKTSAGMGCSFTVTNTGKLPGAEVAQLYLQFPEIAGEPRQLKGFKKTAVLQPGESETVNLSFAPRDFSIWDVSIHDWHQITGEYEAFVGSSSRDFRLRGSFLV